MVQTVVLDFDGVLRFWDDSSTPTLEKAAGLSLGQIHVFAFEPALLRAVVTGAITKQHWLDKTAIGLQCHPDTVARWAARPTSIDRYLLDVLRMMRDRGVCVCLASNGTDELAKELIEFEIGDAFDIVFNSADMGVAKPDRRFFERVIERLGSNPSDILFVDDTPENVGAALELGIAAYQYVAHAPDAKRRLIDRLALVEASDGPV